MTVREEVGEGPPQVPDTRPGPASRFGNAPAQPLSHTLSSSLDFLTPFLGQPTLPWADGFSYLGCSCGIRGYSDGKG